MLTLKLSLPFSWRFLNVRTLARVSNPGDKSSGTTTNSFEDQTKVASRSLKYTRTVEKCPKESFIKECLKKLFPDNSPNPKCSLSSPEDYRRACKAIKIRTEDISKLIENGVQTIEQEIEREIKEIRRNENSLMERILESATPKILELSNLDQACSMKKKTDVFNLNDRIQRELSIHHSPNQLIIKSIQCDLKKMAIDLKSRAECAYDIVYSCRTCTSHWDLIECIEHKSRKAAEVLDDVKLDYENRINEIKIVKEETFRKEKRIVQELTAKYEKKMAELIIEIVDCIRAREEK